MRNYQNEKLPEGAEYVGSSPLMTERDVLKAILEAHMAPKGKCGYLIVEKGKLQFVWEDTEEVFDAAPGHPIVIGSERYHHIRITGRVVFRDEFYKVPDTGVYENDARRPAEEFLKH